MENITRFNQIEVGWMSADGDGDWVKYKDVQNLIAKLEKELADKTKALKEIKEIPNEMYGPDWEEITKAREIAASMLAKYNNT